MIIVGKKKFRKLLNLEGQRDHDNWTQQRKGFFSLGMGILGRAQKSRSTGSSKETFLKEFFLAQTLKRQHKL